MGLRLIFYDKLTGNRLYDCSYTPPFNEPTFDQVYNAVLDLRVREKTTIGFIRYENGEYEQDFAECSGFRVNPTTKALEFAYPDPNNPESPPVFQTPLRDQIKALNERQALSEAAIDFLIMNGGL